MAAWMLVAVSAPHANATTIHLGPTPSTKSDGSIWTGRISRIAKQAVFQPDTIFLKNADLK
jgi:hypothetical protein